MSPSDPAIEPVQFRKRPRTIWAMQWTGDNLEAIQAFVGPSPFDPGPAFNKFAGDHYLLYVAANRSWLPLEVGEWVAKDSQGFYPIKDAVFVDTYDRADGADDDRAVVSTPLLDVDIRCYLPGPQMFPQERALLEQLEEAAKTLAYVLYARHDPDGFAAWWPERELGGIPQARVSVTSPDGSFTELFGPGKPSHTLEPVSEPAKVVPLHPGTEYDPVPDARRFGLGLRALRKERDMTRMQLKVLAGLGNYGILAEIENGHLYPYDDVLDKLAGAFSVSRQELIDTCLRLATHGA